MKTIKLTILILSFVASVVAAEPPKEQKAKPIEMTKAMFLEKVMDYEKNPETWKYLGNKPAIIDFYAVWCGPCRVTSPILADLAAEYSDEIYVYKINIDKERELAKAFGIQSIPTFLFVPMDETPQISMGALPKEAFKEAIDTYLVKKEQKKEQ
ncbi:MAG: thioredoxin [Dysgonamonadaceae bacterium]|jgi:thioredoxin|nr:thioredoxin [Dysgonamonadaceae bacterium]MDD3308378.1 thioredoxin [Dysgonamonadaceae bacterium]MDD3900200.1 thioredoxin [Dysgonamonadaceae bacterium]MDD4398870.1 thioredoxin [Dysgonamonadaceae bacterium]MEA5080995.1 thioredoxin [Dysgonamonadaceae bacterium]